MEPGKSKYELNLDSLQVSETEIVGDLVNTDNNVRFRLALTSLTDGRWRLQVEEAEPIRARYKVQHVLQKEPSQNR